MMTETETTEPRFIQIHTLTSYPGTLLNRDDAGLAKRLPVGGTTRIRISSQCLKRHWRRADDEFALARLGDGLSIRSREIFAREIRMPLVAHGLDPVLTDAVLEVTIAQLLGESAKKKSEKSKRKEDESAGLSTEQVITLGRPEINYISEVTQMLVREAKTVVEAKASTEKYYKEGKENMAALRQIALAGIDAALFGRMVTSDILARGDAAIHVAHAFSVNADAEEPDYFSAVDDLIQESGEMGSGHINSSELTCGLFYGYVVVDVPLLVSNLTGCPRKSWREADRDLPARVVQSLLHLIATVTPGAKLGSTAPYAYADMMLVEAGARQPRTLGNAFLKPVRASMGNSLTSAAIGALVTYLGKLDACYEVREIRRLMTTEEGVAIAGVQSRETLDSLANWTSKLVRGVA